MATIEVDIRGATNPFLKDEPMSLATSDEDAQEAGRLPAEELFDRITEILGYDLFEAALMAEGYAELGAEMLSISEGTIAAQAEALPPE